MGKTIVQFYGAKDCNTYQVGATAYRWVRGRVFSWRISVKIKVRVEQRRWRWSVLRPAHEFTLSELYLTISVYWSKEHPIKESKNSKSSRWPGVPHGMVSMFLWIILYLFDVEGQSGHFSDIPIVGIWLCWSLSEFAISVDIPYCCRLKAQTEMN